MGPPSPRRSWDRCGELPWLNKVTQVGGFGLWLGGEEAEEEKSKELIIKKLEKRQSLGRSCIGKGWLQQVDSSATGSLRNAASPIPNLPDTSPIINTPRGGNHH